MPLQQRELLQLSLLLLCVPVQYYLSSLSKTVREEDRSRTIIRTFAEIESFLSNIFSLSSWTNIMSKIGSLFSLDVPVDVDKLPSALNEDSETIRLFSLKSVHSAVHDTRSNELKYRIGQVIQHKTFSFKGVIIGWESSKKDRNFRQPTYTVLIDESHIKGGSVSSFMEVDQDQVILLKYTQVNHRHLKRYFKNYDGSQYLPHEWLRKFYPID